VEGWYRAFFVETAHVVGALSPEEHGRRAVAGGRVWLWVDEEDAPVSQAVAVALTPTMARLGAVYTPPARRGQGGASLAVAALSQRLLDEGRAPCLFTDLANPTSNSIYKKIGYEAVADLKDFDLA
jgi:predicted GNAT family acetyltransferase